jgi:hypothetical protein
MHLVVIAHGETALLSAVIPNAPELDKIRISQVKISSNRSYTNSPLGNAFGKRITQSITIFPSCVFLLPTPRIPGGKPPWSPVGKTPPNPAQTRHPAMDV